MKYTVQSQGHLSKKWYVFLNTDSLVAAKRKANVISSWGEKPRIINNDTKEIVK